MTSCWKIVLSVYIHAEGPAFFCWIPKLFGKRVISTIHGLDWAREKWKFGVGSKFIRQGEKNAVKYADEIIVLSKGVQKYFMETYGRETHFIPNGVNRPEVREAKLITDHFGLEKDSYILFLGRLVPEKGIRYLVEAFKNVKTDKKMVIADGSSDTDSFMEELKELAKGDDRILFTGFVQGAMLGELYSNAYIYTLPSDLEGMPLSLLEAMSYSNCCLVSDIPECAEVVEDKALIFKKSDVKDLQEKLQDACDHPEMVMKMKKQAADFICEKYNWDDVVKEVCAGCYDGIACRVWLRCSTGQGHGRGRTAGTGRYGGRAAGRGFERKTRRRKTCAGRNAQLLCCGVFGVYVCGRVPRPSDNGRSLGSLRQDSVRTDER